MDKPKVNEALFQKLADQIQREWKMSLGQLTEEFARELLERYLREAADDLRS